MYTGERRQLIRLLPVKKTHEILRTTNVYSTLSSSFALLLYFQYSLTRWNGQAQLNFCHYYWRTVLDAAKNVKKVQVIQICWKHRSSSNCSSLMSSFKQVYNWYKSTLRTFHRVNKPKVSIRLTSSFSKSKAGSVNKFDSWIHMPVLNPNFNWLGNCLKPNWRHWSRTTECQQRTYDCSTATCALVTPPKSEMHSWKDSLLLLKNSTKWADEENRQFLVSPCSQIYLEV